MATRAPHADLDEILVFTRVVQKSSFSAAAAALHMPRSTVSRKLSDLEARVGARLLQRTTRSLQLTDVGRVYYEHCLRVVSELEEAELAVARLRSTPRGLLRLTVPVGFWLLAPLIAEFLRLFPEVQLEMVCTDRRVDIVEERFDLALRAGAAPDSSLIARRLGVVRRRLVATKAVARGLRDVQDPAQLTDHPCVMFAPEGGSWQLQSGARREELSLRPRLVVNDYGMLHGVVRAGFGVALLPEFLCADDLAAGRLVPVLKAWTAPEVPVFALYPSTRHLPPSVLAMLELFQKRLVLST